MGKIFAILGVGLSWNPPSLFWEFLDLPLTMPIWKATDQYKVKCGEKRRGEEIRNCRYIFNRYVLQAVLPKYVHLEFQLLPVYHLQSIDFKYDKIDMI